MPYIEGFVAAVPTANRETYIEQAKQVPNISRTWVPPA